MKAQTTLSRKEILEISTISYNSQSTQNWIWKQARSWSTEH
jgi:hypothetical protein